MKRGAWAAADAQNVRPDSSWRGNCSEVWSTKCNHGTGGVNQEGDVMSLVKFDVAPCEMASALTTESLEEMGLKAGDKVSLIVKAVNVLPVKE